MSYSITIHDAVGDHTVAAEEKTVAELIVKSYIFALLDGVLSAPNHGLDDAAFDKADSVLMELASDLKAGYMHRMGLDSLVVRLATDCLWLSGPHGAPAFTITRHEWENK